MGDNYEIKNLKKRENYLTKLFITNLNVYSAGISGLGMVLCVLLIIYSLFFCNKTLNRGRL